MPNDSMVTAEEALDGSLNADVDFIESDAIDEDPDKEVKVKTPPQESEEEEEDEESSEESEETTEDTEEEQNEDDDKKPDIPFDRPSLSEIKTKYPNFFKDFPQMREAFHREVEFTKIFPTVSDAKEAFEDNEAFVSLRESVITGDAVPLIDALETQSRESVEAFSSNFLKTLYEKNREAYLTTVTPLFENLVRGMHKSTDENTRNAALLLSEYIFGTQEVAEGNKTFQKEIKAPAAKKLDTEVYNKVQTEVGQRANQSLAVILSKEVDPNKALTPFLRNQVIKEIIDQVHQQLSNDAAHRQIMQTRWKKAQLDNFSDTEKAKIISTFLARAKSVYPTIKAKVVKEALGSQSLASKDKIKKIESSMSTRKEVNNGSHRSSSSNSNGKVDYKKMSDMDILNS